jgi:tyrosine-protein kinase Etk/Wzc
MGPIQTLPEILSWLRRRGALIGFVAFLVSVAGVLVALGTERIYQTGAVIQVLNPVIDPRDTNAADTLIRRVQAIEQRIMARDNLLELGERHGLFEGTALSTTERLNLMRQSISIEAVAAAQAGFTRDGSLSALVISASAADPDAAAALANDLAQDVVRENAEARRDRAQSALRFFQAEEERIEGLIIDLEAEMSAFQSQNEAYMPGALSLRRDEMGRLSESRIEGQREIAQYRAELATLDADAGRVVTQRRITQLNDLIRQKTQEIDSLTSRIDEIRFHFQRGTEVERELSSLARRMTQLQGQLTNAAERRREAEIGARLEGDDQSDRFVLLEAALPPDYPISRSRKTVVMAAVVAGLILGAALAYAVEWLNPVLRNAVMFERELQLRPVISLPFHMPARERRRRRSIWAAGGGFLVLAGLALVLAFGVF